MMTAQERRQVIRGCIILMSLIVCAFLWVAVLSFDTTDWPSPHYWPHPDPSLNAAGRAGAWVAYHLFVYFGHGAYAAVAGLSLAIAVLARQGHLRHLWQRVIGISLLIAVVSASAHIVTAGDPSRWPELRGGVLGHFLATQLQSTFRWMTYPILGYTLLVGLLFTAEGLIMGIPRAIRRRREQIAEFTGQVRERVSRSSGVWGMVHGIRRVVSFFRSQPQAQLAGSGPGTGALVVPDVLIEPGGGAESSPGTSRSGRSRFVDDPAASRNSLYPPMEEAIEEDADRPADPEAFEADAEAAASGLADDPSPPAEEETADDPPCPEASGKAAGPVSEAAAPRPRPAEREIIIKTPEPPRHPGQHALVPPRPYPTELRAWELPPISLLEDPEYSFTSQQEAQVREKARILEQALSDYRLEAKVVEIDTGPVVTMFEIQVAPGVKVSQVSSLANDIARALKAPNVRVVAPIPGKTTIGIEVPNLDKEKVRLKELITLAGAATQKMQLPLFLGKDSQGAALVSDLAKMPHMLIAGTTGSGKSVCINSIIASILMTQRPDMVKLILVDPKMVEMSMFRDVPHLMCPIVTEMERAQKILEWATIKMDERYALLAEAGVRNIAAYNRLTREEKRERFQPSTPEEEAQIPVHLPYIIIIIDELADMMMMAAKEVELYLSRLAQKSRAIGIHIIVATQRPEAKIVTGLIKSNLPCRIAFRVASRLDSRIVLDQAGAEVLMGQGDMLFLPPGSAKLLRCQGTFLEDAELKAIIGFLRERGAPEFHPELMQIRNQEVSPDGPRDELFDQAVEIILETRRGSVSLLQRRLTVGYSRASRLIEEMAAAGIVGEYKGSQAREVIITREQWEQMKAQREARLHSQVEEPIRTIDSPDAGLDDAFDDDL